VTTTLAAVEISNGEAVLFWILGPIALAGAFGTVLARNAIHAALFLVMTMGSLGVFYFIQEAPFLGVVQIIVYTGAIMILFLFVLMVVGRDSSDSIVETLRGQRWAATLFGIGFALLLAGGLYRAVRNTPMAGLATQNAAGGNVNNVAELLFTKYLFAFELTSALLITAAVGAMVLTHVEREPGETRGQRALSRERVRSGRPQPLPGPGVFATHDSVATPALLPDGSVAPESVSRLVDEPLTPDELERHGGPGLQPVARGQQRGIEGGQR
jgi:NADH-quinone oxidoreductase subunit J